MSVTETMQDYLNRQSFIAVAVRCVCVDASSLKCYFSSYLQYMVMVMVMTLSIAWKSR